MNIFDSDVFYFFIVNIALLFFIYWAIKEGVVKRNISFGLIGNVKKKGLAARNWGFAFVALGLLLFILQFLFY